MRRDLERAKKLYREFREETPRRAKVVHIKLPKVVMVMGHVRAIEYDTTHAGKTHLYKHTFAPGSRPMLVAGKGRNQLYLVNGRFHVTERGIVDLDPAGREIEDGRLRRRRS